MICIVTLDAMFEFCLLYWWCTELHVPLSIRSDALLVMVQIHVCILLKLKSVIIHFVVQQVHVKELTTV